MPVNRQRDVINAMPPASPSTLVSSEIVGFNTRKFAIASRIAAVPVTTVPGAAVNEALGSYNERRASRLPAFNACSKRTSSSFGL